MSRYQTKAPSRGAHLTEAMRLRGAATKRAHLVEEFGGGLTYAQAARVRNQYYQQGYSRARERFRAENAHLARLVEALRAQMGQVRASVQTAGTDGWQRLQLTAILDLLDVA
jgi:hypothetical protein